MNVHPNRYRLFRALKLKKSQTEQAKQTKSKMDRNNNRLRVQVHQTHRNLAAANPVAVTTVSNRTIAVHRISSRQRNQRKIREELDETNLGRGLETD